jgi:uncharacterized protein with beta-barrel porin domain
MPRQSLLQAEFEIGQLDGDPHNEFGTTSAGCLAGAERQIRDGWITGVVHAAGSALVLVATRYGSRGSIAHGGGGASTGRVRSKSAPKSRLKRVRL